MDINQFVAFRIDNQYFGIDVMAVEEIICPIKATPIPRSPSCVIGIVSIRDKVMPLVCLRQKMNLPSIEETPDTRIIVVSVMGNPIGLIVDKLDAVISIPIDDIDVAPGRANIHESYIEGVARTQDKVIVLLNVLNLFNQNEYKEFARIKEQL